MNQLRSSVCQYNFSWRLRLNVFLKRLMKLFSAFAVSIRLCLRCSNILGSFKASMLLSTSLICLALAVRYVVLYCCLLSNYICLLIVAEISSEFLSVYFFLFCLFFLRYFTPHEDNVETHWVFFTIFSIRPGLVTCILRLTWISSLCSISSL